MAKTCNMCENLIPDQMGGISGYCKAQPLGQALTYKAIRYDDDATNCPNFSQVDPDEVITDGVEASWHPMRRIHGSIEE